MAPRCSWSPVSQVGSLCLLPTSPWHPTPVLLPGKSHGRRSLVGCSPWVAKSRTRLKRLSSSSSIIVRLQEIFQAQKPLEKCLKIFCQQKRFPAPNATNKSCLVEGTPSLLPNNHTCVKLMLYITKREASLERVQSDTPSPRAWRPDFPGAAREAP